VLIDQNRALESTSGQLKALLNTGSMLSGIRNKSKNSTKKSIRKSTSTDRNRVDLLIDAFHPEFKTMLPKPKKPNQKFQPFQTQSRDLLLNKPFQKDPEKDSVSCSELEKKSRVCI
jgi:hypothetical protein